MKKYKLFTLTFFVMGGFALMACGGADNSITMYVNAKSGLLVRADASTNASKLGVVPYGEAVKVLAQSDQLMTIAGKTGNWTRIQYNDLEGWSFGGFLSATPLGSNANNQSETCSKLLSCLDRIKECDIVNGCDTADAGYESRACYEKYQSGCPKNKFKALLNARCRAAHACDPCIFGVDGCGSPELDRKHGKCHEKANASLACGPDGRIKFPADFYADYSQQL